MPGKTLGKRRWGLAIATITCAATAALPSPAAAVLSGTNGRIVFTSARDPFTTATSQLYLRPTFSGSGGPGGASLITPSSTTQRRHATWSPDRTKIAFAQGDSSTSNFDIYILDLTDPNAIPQNITNSNNVTDDRPAWSPDGTRIAWESEVTDGSGQQDILVDAAPFGSVDLNLTNNGSVVSDAKPAGRPAWSPDSQTVYYSVGDLNVPPNGSNNDVQIFQEPADNTGTPAPLVHISGAHTFQPSISPDGTRICYTESATAGLNTNAAVFVAPLNDASTATVLAASGAGDYNCTWSPDGQFIAYVDGIFTTGDLVMERSDNSSLGPTLLETTANRFDGNPDWAPDGRPQCQDRNVTTQKNKPVSIPLDCADTGPAYERTSVRAFVLDGSGPTHGVVSTTDPQLLPASITYTPNPGFLGTDSFKVRSIDEPGFGDRDGTVTVNVRRPVFCRGKVSTIVGTGGADTITGTPRADVISSLGGNDRVKAAGRNDLICGGRGKDTLNGNNGNDKLYGQQGKDTLKGGPGKDTLKGGPGKDKLRGGPGKDKQVQ
jgi:Tol biopolymer transport system component